MKGNNLNKEANGIFTRVNTPDFKITVSETQRSVKGETKTRYILKISTEASEGKVLLTPQKVDELAEALDSCSDSESK
jgi:hypothetical protein